VKTFEKLQIWKDTKILANEIYSIDFKRDLGFNDQIQKAAVSIMSNIAEGFECGSNLEFIKYLTYSKGSAGEVRSLISLALDLKYIDEVVFDRVYEHSINISKQIANFIKYLKSHTTKLFN
jgi:four helix bundle protein